MYRKWRKLAWDANLLALESEWVIAMRLAKLSKGGRSASREASRMVTEKLSAMGEAGRKLATGGSGHSVIKQYRRKVRSNLRRLKK